MYKIGWWSFLILSSTLLQIRIKFCINYFMHYLLPTTKKKWKKYRICFRIHTEFYIYHLRKYRMNLRFTFYESLQAQCSKQEYKFVYKILYPIYSQSKKNDQKTDYRIITVSDRFHPYLPPLMGPVDAWRPEASEGSNARPLGEHNRGAHRKCQMAVPSSLVGTRRVRQACYCCDKGVRVRSWM